MVAFVTLSAVQVQRLSPGDPFLIGPVLQAVPQSKSIREDGTFSSPDRCARALRRTLSFAGQSSPLALFVSPAATS